MNQHLSTVQISAWVAGEHAEGTQRHIRECPACHAELTGFESGLMAFGHSVRQWAAQQDRQANPQALSHASWRWALGAAAILAVALLPAYWQGEVPISAAQDDDARLLRNIDIHLSRTVPSSMEPLMTLMNLTQERKDERE